MGSRSRFAGKKLGDTMWGVLTEELPPDYKLQSFLVEYRLVENDRKRSFDRERVWRGPNGERPPGRNTLYDTRNKAIAAAERNQRTRIKMAQGQIAAAETKLKALQDLTETAWPAGGGEP